MFKGIYTIEKYEAKLVNGEWVATDLIETIEKENNITPDLLYRFHENDSINGFEILMNEAIFKDGIAAYFHSPDTNWIGGTVTVGRTYVAATNDTDPYWYCVTTYNPPTSTTRYIRTMALSGDSGAQDSFSWDESNTYMPISMISLADPCTQTTTQILQVTYRLFYNTNAALTYTNLKSFMLSSVSQKYGNTSGGYSWAPEETFFASVKAHQLTGIIDRGLTMKYINLNNTGSSASLRVNEPYNIDSKNGVRRCDVYGYFGDSDQSTSPDTYIGFPLKAVGWGYPRSTTHRHYIWSPVDKGTTSSLQNIYPKSAYVSGTRNPYLIIDQIADSPCSINVVDDGSWVSNIDDDVTPYLYRIVVTATGPNGVATYKVRRRRMFHVATNNWNYQLGCCIPTLPPHIGAGARGITIDDTPPERYGFISNAAESSETSPGWYHGIAHSVRGGITVQKYFYPQFIGFESAGITIADVNGNHISFDNTGSPVTLPCTDILQVVSDGTTILVACGNTGLWKIERPWNDWTGASTTITQITPAGITNPNSCRGIAVKNIGAIVGFRIINGGINYQVGDTVYVDTENSMGSGFAGTVGSVDINGAITSITITTPGTGYHADNVAARITSAGSPQGTGAKLDPLVGANGNWWAIFDDTADVVCYLASSTNGGTTWSLYNEGTTPQFLLSNYTSGTPGPVNIIGLHIDPNHPDDRLLIQAPTVVNDTTTTGTNGQFFWWSRSGSFPTTNQVRANNSSGAYALGEKRVGTLCVSTFNNTNQWMTKGIGVSAGAIWNWGSASPVAASSSNNNFGTAVPTTMRGRTGNDVIAGHIGESAHLVAKDAADINTANYEAVLLGASYNNTWSGDQCVSYNRATPNIQYIGKGVFLSWSNVRWATNSPTYQHNGWCTWTPGGDGTETSQDLLPYGVWENYGWNGSAWQLGHAGSKTMHATQEPLLDGLQISFNDNVGIDSFINGEYYEVHLFDGILHDNTTRFSFSFDIYYGAAERGTDFFPATVPGADLGLRTDEPFTIHSHEDTYRWYNEPGTLVTRISGAVALGDQELTGDFEFKFRRPTWMHANQAIRFGVVPWANVVGGSRSTSIFAHNFLIYDSTSSPTLTAYTVQCRDTYGGGVVQTVNVVDGSPDDIFAIERVGTNLYFKRNGVTFRTATTSSTGSVAIGIYAPDGGATVRDMKITYTCNRRLVDIGNGTTTGRYNPNYGRVATVGRGGTNGEFAVFLNGVPATILTDGYTPPAAGQVNWLTGRGSLWCNTADAGATITGKWIAPIKVNFE